MISMTRRWKVWPNRRIHNKIIAKSICSHHSYIASIQFGINIRSTSMNTIKNQKTKKVDSLNQPLHY